MAEGRPGPYTAGTTFLILVSLMRLYNHTFQALSPLRATLKELCSSTNMASSPAAPALAERGDIHKSCKSIETLLNILSEYCEAAGTVVSLQKKLAKALKDAASSKATAEIACVFVACHPFMLGLTI